ncbi:MULTISPECIES: fimbrial protein [Escherichia]|uniref:Fimbrial protein n=1 Tax=Escherichia marmotae TaxID=1499973 RepID=A0A7L5X8P5_9ESCH|nr:MULTISPECIES: fimbrial protein [Escherichia]AUT26847.1 fimbrial protein [Escherichia marmotae]MCR6674167.1 fimbrial protein [Escherichia marmotae]MDQ9283455.1 fimbrial protein [Escherichia marmotae]MEC9674935.1 fimbrial protein [Escherichia marmotae]MED0607177.1 fimbrial protein [Escherichia marmotae]
MQYTIFNHNGKKTFRRTTILRLFAAIGMATSPVIVSATTFDLSAADTSTKPYILSNTGIPAQVGGKTWFDDWGQNWSLKVSGGGSGTAYAEVTINGQEVAGFTGDDGATVYKTSNPGIGIAYQVTYRPDVSTPIKVFNPPFRLDFSGAGAGGFFIVRYELIRLTDFLPAGQIVPPTVTVTYHNPDGTSKTFTARSGTSGQPKYTACTITAPKEIKLPTLYGKDLVNGVQGETSVPKISLTNCPGAMDSINYKFTATYGTHDAANGVMKAQTGNDYAKNVYIRFMNGDNTPYNQLNSPKKLTSYIGSGNYDLPDFKVGYFIDDINTVTAGKVNSALQLDVTYN